MLNKLSTLMLPNLNGQVVPFTLAPGAAPAASGGWTRTAYAAGHVVSDPLADCDPWLDAPVDWDRTLAFREHLWGLGFGVAEAMDTAQRGMGLDWPTSLELIRRSQAVAKAGVLVPVVSSPKVPFENSPVFRV